MIKVSVILPVYGVAAYIEKCTQSLLTQTLPDMEFIFVDDHGPDNSIELAKQTIKGHPREKQFVFLRPEHNLGAGMARNFAIPQAKGEYIAFVDSDDWIEPDMFEQLYNRAKQINADICCSEMRKCYLDGSTGECLKNPRVEEGVLTEEKRKYILANYVSLFASMLYRKNFLVENKILFSPDKSADDSCFVSCVWLMAQSIAYVDQAFYNYLIRPGSVCTTKQSDKYQKRLTSIQRIVIYAKEHKVYDDFKQEIDFLYIKKGYIASVLSHIINSTQPSKEALNEIYQQLCTLIPDYKKNNYLRHNLTIRILIIALRLYPICLVKPIRYYASKKNLML